MLSRGRVPYAIVCHLWFSANTKFCVKISTLLYSDFIAWRHHVMHAHGSYRKYVRKLFSADNYQEFPPPFSVICATFPIKLTNRQAFT